MSSFRSAIAIALLSGVAFASAHAAGNEDLSDCVDLSSQHETARFGSQYLLVKDGESHYRLGFGGSCGEIAISTRVQLRAEGKDGRICPSGTTVRTKRGSCTVRGVASISAEQYESYARRGR
jgi:hypothetical protein